MSILCRLGIHQTFADTIWTNLGTTETPFYIATTYQTCNRCDWTTAPRGTT